MSLASSKPMFSTLRSLPTIISRGQCKYDIDSASTAGKDNAGILASSYAGERC